VYISEKNMSGCLSKNIISLFSVARSNSWGDKSYIG
jgi:hypothetical protein